MAKEEPGMVTLESHLSKVIADLAASVDRRVQALTSLLEQRFSLEQKAMEDALAAHHREHAAHSVAHDREHLTFDQAIQAALDSHHREHISHAEAHNREHQATEKALQKAEEAIDKRLYEMNKFRELLKDQATNFITRDMMDAHTHEFGARWEANRQAVEHIRNQAATHGDLAALRSRVEALEKNDVAASGVQQGMNRTTAIIVGSITLVGTILGIMIVIVNILSS